ncbi:crotonase/enoyl-CoA hydratase family protein [Bradyrhizobium tropiciagri]|uniref:crotonase/enoyl-CoA hydratase family protein n=1 Tax=Bradyrhizobium tropiciagri TaxID=312253 RepID=UPI001BA99A58|nr:crotonase/enoyl-CoA hydratase family protein [Bradyrhizobium tropiciagri]MBR0899140.1 crotonase/enoyl-CoA hydratase family protein [Bradyrhizobium tropiciagri]
MSERVRIEINAGIAEVRLSRSEKRNALDGAMFDALIEAGETLKGAHGVRAVVLSGEGPGFCAGIDMRVLAEMQSGKIAGVGHLASRTHGICNRFQYAAWIWREIPAPVIAAVHGFALGGGFELALGADIRYLTPNARLGVMEVRWGLIPDMGATQLMRHLAREDIVRELAYTGCEFSGTEALAYGFATRLADDPRSMAFSTARQIADRSPHAVRALKRLFNRAVVVSPEAGLIDECIEQQVLVGSRNQMETVHADREGRPPRFEEATPATVTAVTSPVDPHRGLAARQ